MMRNNPEQPNAAKSGMAHLPSLVKGAAINLTGTMTGKVLAFAYTFLLARMLTAGDVGLYFLSLTVFQFIGTVAVFGLNAGMVRFIPIYRARRDRQSADATVQFGLWLSMTLGVLAAAGLALFSHPLAARAFDKPELARLFVAIAPALPFWVAGTVLVACTRALGRMQYGIYVRQLTEPISRFVVTVGLFVAGLRLWGAVIAFAISAVLGFLQAWYYKLRLFPQARRGGWLPAEWRQIIFFSLPQTFSRFLMMVILWTDTLMVGALGTAEDVGLYGIAARTAALGSVVSEAFSLMFGPMIAGRFEKGQQDELRSILQSATKWALSLGFPVLLVFLSLPGAVLGVYGAEYVPASRALLLLALAQLVLGAAGPVGQLLLMSGHPWLNFADNIGAAIVNVVLNATLIPRFGLMGAATATLSSLTLVSLMRLTQVYRHTRLQPFRAATLKPFTAGATALLTGLGLGALLADLPPVLVVLIAGGALCLVFVGVLLALGFDEDDRFILARLRARFSRES